ncbi:MAG: amidohydrolase family protein, partial [Planctomycetaceae bacterium]|nr:amidohydrolase family protein [Planctomycetaceae bacterium]
LYQRYDPGHLPTPPALAPSTALYFNGLIYTGVPEAPWAEAMVTRGDKLVFIGSNEEASTSWRRPELRVDLGGKFVMAGIVDAHTHPGMVAILAEDEETVASPMPAKPKQAIFDWLRQYKKENLFTLVISQGEWDVAEFLPDGPNKAALDEVFPLKPVILFDNSGHSTWVNSAMMKLLGVNKDTPDISRNISEFVRDEQGEPTG